MARAMSSPISLSPGARGESWLRAIGLSPDTGGVGNAMTLVEGRPVDVLIAIGVSRAGCPRNAADNESAITRNLPSLRDEMEYMTTKNASSKTCLILLNDFGVVVALEHATDGRQRQRAARGVKNEYTARGVERDAVDTAC